MVKGDVGVCARGGNARRGKEVNAAKEGQEAVNVDETAERDRIVQMCKGEARAEAIRRELLAASVQGVVERRTLTGW